MADRTNFHQFSSLTPRLQTEIAYRMDLSSLGALAQTSTTMNGIAKLPLLYVKFRVESAKAQTTRLPQAPQFSDLPEWTKKRLEKFVVRLTVIERFPELNQLERAKSERPKPEASKPERPKPERPASRRHQRSASQPVVSLASELEGQHSLSAIPTETRPAIASRHDVFKRLVRGASKEEILREIKTMQPLAALQMLGESFELLLGDMGKESAQALSEALQRIPIPGRDSTDFSISVDAHLVLLHAAHTRLCGREKKSGTSTFTSTLFTGVKNFVLHSSLQKAHLIDTPKFHLLIGELVRSFAYARNWNRTKTEANFKTYFIGASALTHEQWAAMFSLATSHQEHPKWSYQQLQALQSDQPAQTAKVKNTHKRSASMSVIAPMPKPDEGCVELEKFEQTEAQEANSKPDKTEQEVRGARKGGRKDKDGRDSCVLS